MIAVPVPHERRQRRVRALLRRAWAWCRSVEPTVPGPIDPSWESWFSGDRPCWSDSACQQCPDGCLLDPHQRRSA